MTNRDDTRWLDAEEREAWIGLMAVLTSLPAALDRQLRADAGMTHFDYQVMVVLAQADAHTMRMSSLSVATGGSLPRLSQVASRLEKAGWIERHRCPDDGRTTLATLTADGVAALAAAAPAHVAEVQRLVFDALTREQVSGLAEIMDCILQAPGSAPDPRPGRAT